MPPYDLPANSHTMGFKSNSTKGGGGYNEIVIVDGKAGELIRIRDPKGYGKYFFGYFSACAQHSKMLPEIVKPTEGIGDERIITF